MPTFLYKAVDQIGRNTQGQMDAVNEADLEMRLERMGLDLITVKASTKKASFLVRNSVTNQDLIFFSFQLEQLTSAGVPMLEGLSDIQDASPNPYFQKVISGMISEIESGKMLSQAMAVYPDVFDEVYVSLVTAGEKTGKLSEVFDHLATTLTWQQGLVAKAKLLLIYPIIVVVFVLAAIVFLMMYLVPKLVSFLQNMGQELPLHTKILIYVSDIFVNYWWLIFSLPILAVIVVTSLVKNNPNFRYQFDVVKLRLPITGETLKKIILARFTRYFALMYQSGIPVLDAIKTCEGIVGNRAVAAALARVHQQVYAGGGMSESFQNAGLFPVLVVKMIRVGENTGALDRSLLKISDFYDRDVNVSLESAMKLIEPILVLVLGLVLGFIMLSVFSPIYDSFSKLNL